MYMVDFAFMSFEILYYIILLFENNRKLLRESYYSFDFLLHNIVIRKKVRGASVYDIT